MSKPTLKSSTKPLNQSSSSKIQSSSSLLSSSSKPDHQLKLLLIGNSGSGKSSILMRYSDNKFQNSYYSTIGVDFWDTAGQDRFKTIVSSYYRGANGILIVYDVTDRTSFQSIKNWLEQIQKLTDQNVVKFIIGNKNDLEEKRQVTYNQGKILADQLRIPFKQTSAKQGKHINEVFTQMTEEILGFKRYNNTAPQPNSAYVQPKKDQNVYKLSEKPKKKQQESSCCQLY